NSTGQNNTADGFQALYSNTTGLSNTGVGLSALAHNTTGNYNIAVGASAGSNITTGSSNIEIGNAGAAGDTSTIRIGTSQTATYIAGISGRAVTGADVVVDGMGKLGVVASSARYKRDIRDMGTTSNALMKLRPVTFRYKSDERGATQYGLIAEEVQRVYPELVMFDADGKVETVRYSMLISMLLNELQKQSQERCAASGTTPTTGDAAHEPDGQTGLESAG